LQQPAAISTGWGAGQSCNRLLQDSKGIPHWVFVQQAVAQLAEGAMISTF
jgi:hypothetical protein